MKRKRKSIEGQISIFEYLEEKNRVCKFSNHTCNKANLWEVADTLDEILCPHVCCRICAIRNCGARCNGSEEPKSLTPAEEYFEDTGKTTYWQDSQGKPYQWWKSEKVSMFGQEWIPITEKPKDITQYDILEILGPYKSIYGDRWSLCKAYYDGKEVIALNVPIDIPRPEWKYWRLREKVYPVDIRGLCDDAYCPHCNASLDDLRFLDCQKCPWCGTRIDWEPWHRRNDEEETVLWEAEE